MRAKGLIVAGGQGAWAGRILRFGHMGAVGIEEMSEAVRVMGETLAEMGRPADVGAALRAMSEVYEARLAAPVG
jgi:aspartate aminotransferase-like enzyme